ncbi:MAG: DUF3536 domain-containing protein [Nitrospiraceae bacterium]|jgi:alpha-amylase/alpha-mannosidase (GH57 family)|nr:MAG: DUF3536 domain-containing protein [Nitrospiraceae bacterium]
MRDRYVCIHGHFYQPPRENPWLEAIEIQDSAHPYHDWNERINAECYAPNAASRIVDGERRIMSIISNYARMSFNFGPTLLSWTEMYAPVVYQAILEADRQSIELRSGHGSALAQVYNHIIMPLANTRDKRTQVLWGIRDFLSRFKRFPEGMWLSEAAVDLETLDLLAEQGILFTILAPHQAERVRKLGMGKWKEVSGGRIDPSRAYLCRLPSGRDINVFFYDGPISQAVAFEKILFRGENFISRLFSGFSDDRNWPQILNIATDGETYGHHHKFGDMALTYALDHIDKYEGEGLTNYGEFLEKYPPTHEVQIFENSSWSCIHGIERWRSNCGCNSGGRPGWNQAWRRPLRDALDWLREELAFRFEHRAELYLKGPWKARDEYIDVVRDRGEANIENFFEEHSARRLNQNEKSEVLKLLEQQRHAMLMYTSCGWFFDELSGIETVQVLQYAGRAIQLTSELFDDKIEQVFLEKLYEAKSNIPEFRDAAFIYETRVRPSIINLKKVGVHYAVSSLFEEYPENADIYCYQVRREDYSRILAGRTKLAVGRISVKSRITWNTETLSFCVVHLGDHALNGGVRPFVGDEEYQFMKSDIVNAFERGEFVDIIRKMDRHFGMHNYSLMHLFRDEQRKILNLVISETVDAFEAEYRRMYENNRILMGFLHETGMPVPKSFMTAAEFVFNLDMKREFEKNDVSLIRIRQLLKYISKWNIPLETVELEFLIRKQLERLMETFSSNPSEYKILLRIQSFLEIIRLLPMEVNFWHSQNIYYKMVHSVYPEILIKARDGDEEGAKWVEIFKKIGEMLFFNRAEVLPVGDRRT